MTRRITVAQVVTVPRRLFWLVAGLAALQAFLQALTEAVHDSGPGLAIWLIGGLASTVLAVLVERTKAVAPG